MCMARRLKDNVLAVNLPINVTIKLRHEWKSHQGWHKKLFSTMLKTG